MDHLVLTALLSLFAVGAGFFMGAGSYTSVRGALIPGSVAGLLISIPSLREHDWISAAILIGCALVGSVIAAYLSDQNRLKRFCREQTNLVIHCGSYKLGRSKDD